MSYQDKTWDGLSKKYAAMITRMDRDIGRIIEKVKQSKEDTLIIFSSDNGPQSGGTTENTLTKFFDSNGEQRGIKRDVYNGGIRVPFIAWWPGKIKANSKSAHISSFQDFLPTVCELIGSKPKNNTDGISYLSTLKGQSEKQNQHEWLYWEFIRMGKSMAGRQAVLNPRLGFKAVRFGQHSPVELYRFEEDVSESKNLAGEYPEIVKKMTKYLDSCRSKSELWPASYLETPLLSTFSPQFKRDKKPIKENK